MFGKKTSRTLVSRSIGSKGLPSLMAVSPLIISGSHNEWVLGRLKHLLKVYHGFVSAWWDAIPFLITVVITLKIPHMNYKGWIGIIQSTDQVGKFSLPLQPYTPDRRSRQIQICRSGFLGPTESLRSHQVLARRVRIVIAAYEPSSGP